MAENIDALLAHTEWVRSLALSLVHPDEAGADDVVQDTWVAVLEHRPRTDGNVRRWLGTVVRNIVRQDRRGEGRRRRREAAGARGEALPDAASVVERAELHRRVVHTVMKLEEPYRTALLLRYFENLPPRDMAARLDRPVETVRAQVRRGLAILRARLDRAWGDRAAWISALAPLLEPIAGAAKTAGASATGGALLGLKAKIVVGGLLVAAVGTGAVLGPSLLDSGPDEVPVTPETVAAQPIDKRRIPDARTDETPAPPKPVEVKKPARPTPPKARTTPPVTTRPGKGASRPAPTASATPSPDRTPRAADKGAATPEPPPRRTFRPSAFKSHIRALARLFRNLEDASSRGNLAGLKEAARWTREIAKYVDRMARTEVDPLKIPEFWWHVFSHPDYRQYKGKRGETKATWRFNRMGVSHAVEYCCFVPKLYTASRPKPLVLCLHPPGPGGMTHEDYLSRFYPEGKLRRQAILVAPALPEIASPGNRWSDRPMLYASMGLVGTQILPEYNVDWRRWFLDGYGPSGVEVWKLAAQYADNFAGVIVRGAAPPGGIRFEDFRNTAFLLIGVPGMPLDPRVAKRVAKRMEKAGVQEVRTAAVPFTPFPGQEEQAFRSVEGEVIRFLRNVRDPYPARLDWSVKENNTRRCCYVKSMGEVEVEAIRDEEQRKIPPSFQVEVDRPNNKLVLECHRIVAFRVQLNDALLDLDRPVTIVVNGKEVVSKKLDRSLLHLYDHVRNSGDWTRIYPCSVTVEVPKSLLFRKAGRMHR